MVDICEKGAQLKMKGIAMVTFEFVAGYFCGEGWFYAQNVGKYRAFSLGVDSHKRDLPLLKAITEKLGYGYIRKKVLKNRETDYIQYVVAQYKDILQFIDTIGPHLIGYKKEQFLVWNNELSLYKIGKRKKANKKTMRASAKNRL